jgi:2-succinyl-5-enolpyruvyl-6-hydroxy-3-cyclohexene-1-carboxylate synthase
MADTHNAQFAATLAGAFADLGMAGVCISPGSRSTPLALAFAGSAIPAWIHHDERSAGFFALGLAKHTGLPVGLVCTSGTAAVEYHPAVVEASQANVPLIVMTADRPPELRDVGAPQTIDQVKLYGDAVRWFFDAAPPDADAVRTAPSLAARAWASAMEPPAGPVHLNLPFREPLVSAGEPPPSRQAPAPTVVVGRPAIERDAARSIRELIEGRRTLHVVGEIPPDAAEPVATLAARHGGVTLADPRSGLRFGRHAGEVLAAGDMLAAAGMLDREPPQAVVRWGTLPTSKPAWRWLEEHPGVPQAVVGGGSARDPLGTARLIVRSDPRLVAQALDVAPAASAWRDRWMSADAAASQAIDAVLAAEPFPSEPAVAATVARNWRIPGAVFAASSMPIRDLDSFGGRRIDPLRIHANRGANGIDGSISTALGIAASGVPTVALVGDVAALHDVGALATVARLDLPLSIVVVHNDGGGIFTLLPQADPSLVDRAMFERVFGTPHGTDFVAVAGSFGLDASEVGTRPDLVETLGRPGPRLVQVHTDRSRLAPLRRQIVTAVRQAIGGP